MGRLIGRDLAGAVTVAEEVARPRGPARRPGAAGTAVMVARHGRRLRKVVHESAVLGVQKTYYVYLPGGVASRTARHPVVYFFRGHEDEWVNPRQDWSRRRRTVIDAYEELLHRGKVGPMVLVFPGMASSDNHVSSILANMRDPKRAVRKGGIGSGRFEDYFVKELVPLVERSYPVRRGGRHRGAVGFSLGGLMAAKVALQYPGLLSSVSAYDGTFLWKDLKRDQTLRNHIFDAAFGVPRDFELVEANSPWHLIDRLSRAALLRIRWLIEYGPEEAEPDDSNFYRGRALVKKLARLGVRNEGGVVIHGHHDWQTADGHATRTLPHHFEALS